MAELKASYFSHGKRNDRHLNISNTVLINKGDDVWYLGYVQNVDGDNLFVDLSCAKFPPFWIHASQVWMHRRFVRTKSWHTCGATGDFPVPGECHCQLPQVQVALRDEEGGPYIFRSAGFLGYMCDTMYSFGYVRRNPTDAGSSHKGQYELIHRWQLVAALPVDEPPLSATIRRMPLITKHAFDLRKIYWEKSVDEREIRRAVRRAYRLPISFGNRGIFVRIDSGRITFVVLKIDEHHLRICSSNKTIVAAVKEELVVCSPCSHISERIVRVFLDFGGYIPLWTKFTHLFGKKMEEEAPGELKGNGSFEEPSFDTILHDILLLIIAHLDVHSQAMARRVCTSWNATLSGSRKSLHACITLDVQKTLLTCPMPGSNWSWELAKEDAAYDAAFLLHRTITPSTRALVIFNLNQHLLTFKLSLISSVLRFKNVVLSTVILKDYQNFAEMQTHHDFPSYHQLRDLPVLMKQCRTLLVLNYTINDSVCDCVVRVTPDSILKAYCVIPKVAFNCSDLADSTAVTRCFLMQLEQHLPNVDEYTKYRFRKKHEKWVGSLPYPDGWQDFRRLLRMHSANEAANSDRFWDDLDLRRFEDLPISKLAWHLISRNGLFI